MSSSRPGTALRWTSSLLPRATRSRSPRGASRRRPYAFDRNTEEIALDPSVSGGSCRRFSSRPRRTVSWSSRNHGAAAISSGVPACLWRREAGISPRGRYVALELEGEPIKCSISGPGTRCHPGTERELRRKEKRLETLATGPRAGAPSELHILDLAKDQRYRVTAFNGDHFEWYRARNYWSSFILWGIEGKQLHRNVAVTDIAERLRMLDKGEVPLGMALVTLEGVAIETEPVVLEPATPAAETKADAEPWCRLSRAVCEGRGVCSPSPCAGLCAAGARRGAHRKALPPRRSASTCS